MMTLKKEKSLLISLMVLVVLFLTTMFSPIDAFATDGTTNGTDIDVQMGSDGSVTISGAGFTAQNDGSAWTNFFTKYKTIISGVSGIAAITFIAFFIFYFMKLGATAGNPQARSQTLMGLLWTGIAAAGLGSVSIVVGFFYNSMK